ncbi:hypothetical protein [Terribacillus sp. DMT04]|uniref:hypothetical protein n=1 Tax=Terribacillus sp. DMT04 TaxID=2850441 RepID=UPI001C2C316E|nr:hypothetical protein [Terribacillus sp. DMT04]QXE03184.1 hypothetical protein KS242_08455 [Terribacillus sp. DMT04]
MTRCIIFVLVVLAVIFTGCSNSERMATSKKDISEVSVSKSEDYGGLNEAFIGILTVCMK